MSVYKNEKNNDIYSKARISTAISLMDINQLSTTLKISKRKLIHFNISLLSGIIKKIKNNFCQKTIINPKKENQTKVQFSFLK